MRPRHAVPLTPSDATLVCFPPPTLLESTLTGLLATVDSKALMESLSPLDATLTKNGGRGKLWLTRNPKKGFYPERPAGAEGPLLHPPKCVRPGRSQGIGHEGAPYSAHSASPRLALPRRASYNLELKTYNLQPRTPRLARPRPCYHLPAAPNLLSCLPDRRSS